MGHRRPEVAGLTGRHAGLLVGAALLTGALVLYGVGRTRPDEPLRPGRAASSPLQPVAQDDAAASPRPAPADPPRSKPPRVASQSVRELWRAVAARDTDAVILALSAIEKQLAGRPYAEAARWLAGLDPRETPDRLLIFVIARLYQEHASGDLARLYLAFRDDRAARLLLVRSLAVPVPKSYTAEDLGGIEYARLHWQARLRTRAWRKVFEGRTELGPPRREVVGGRLADQILKGAYRMVVEPQVVADFAGRIDPGSASPEELWLLDMSKAPEGAALVAACLLDGTPAHQSWARSQLIDFRESPFRAEVIGALKQRLGQAREIDQKIELLQMWGTAGRDTAGHDYILHRVLDEPGARQPERHRSLISTMLYFRPSSADAVAQIAAGIDRLLANGKLGRAELDLEVGRYVSLLWGIKGGANIDRRIEIMQRVRDAPALAGTEPQRRAEEVIRDMIERRQ